MSKIRWCKTNFSCSKCGTCCILCRSNSV